MDFKYGFMTIVLAASIAIAGVSLARAETVDGSVRDEQRVADQQNSVRLDGPTKTATKRLLQSVD